MAGIGRSFNARNLKCCRAPWRSITTAAEAAQQMIRSFEGQTLSYKQTLDGHQLQKLSLTLNRRYLHLDLDISARPPPSGTPIPPGYHLVYFAPAALESELGPDGTDRTFNSPPPFTRRMWAGGRMQWIKGQELTVGEEVEERTKLVGATAKKSRDGTDMVIVDVEKEFWGKRGLALVDQRSWVFRAPAQPSTPVNATSNAEFLLPRSSSCLDISSDNDEYPKRQLSWSPVALFRFSALTFNGHAIHYNESWTRNVEGHPNVVVHGPLNLINMMDYWRDIHGNGMAPREINYRAMSPLYAGDEYLVRTDSVDEVDGGKCWQILVEKKGRACMKGRVVAGP